jgi:hypothetical protein
LPRLRPSSAPESTTFTLLFVGAVLIGTAVLSRWRTWPWPPILVLLLTVPQMNDWLHGGPPVPVALAGIAATGS